MSDSGPHRELDEVLHAKITLETAQIPWHELQRFFAAGKAIWVGQALDLVEVAAALADDRADRFNRWLEAEQVAPVSAEQAGDWHAEDAQMWAVVVAPWVLVQRA